VANRRMITSDIFADDWYGQLGFFEQQLWIGLFAKCADDQGRLLDNSFLIRAALFPYKDVAGAEIDAVLTAFAEAGKILRYEGDGKALVQICNWWDHQRPQWASPSQWPAPEGWRDRVRTRVSGQYVEDGWDCAGGFTLGVQVNGSGEPPSREVRAGRQSPVPVPVPAPVPIPVPVPAEEEAPRSASAAAAAAGPSDPITTALFEEIGRTGQLVSQAIAEQWREVVEEHRAWLTPELVRECFASAAANNVARPSPRYVAAILERCARDGARPGDRPPRASPRASPPAGNGRPSTRASPMKPGTLTEQQKRWHAAAMAALEDTAEETGTQEAPT
jgi:hypothetical protein